MVEGLIREDLKPLAKVVTEEVYPVADGRVRFGAETGVGVFIDRRAIDPEHFANRPVAPFPKPPTERAAPASQIEPSFAGLRNAPVEGVRQQAAVGSNFLLRPEGLRTFGVWPEVL